MNREVTALLNDIKDCAEGVEADVILEQFEEYLRNVKFQKTFKEIGELYAKQESEKAFKLMSSFADWQNKFSLRQNEFIDVGETFESRFKRNREKHNQESKLKPITRFYIDGLDEMNAGRDLRTQLTCFLAPTGVGKSHAARWVGKCSAQMDGLNVLHFQLEGSKDEVTDAYSASLVECSSFRYNTGTIKDRDFAVMIDLVKAMSGTLKVRAYPKFANQVSTLDIKNGIQEYKKLFGYNPDVVIIDSMDLLTDSSGRKWSENGERHRRIAVANDLKDLAGEENVWMVVTYQATIENKDFLNDESKVLTEYNCAEAKGLARPMTHLITLNQSDNEMKEDTMRLYVAKSRFFKKGDPIKIATDYENEKFYDKERTMNLRLVS
jgi:replicative DNA helicase